MRWNVDKHFMLRMDWGEQGEFNENKSMFHVKLQWTPTPTVKTVSGLISGSNLQSTKEISVSDR